VGSGTSGQPGYALGRYGSHGNVLIVARQGFPVHGVLQALEPVVPVWCRFSRATGGSQAHAVHGRRLSHVFVRGRSLASRTFKQRVAGFGDA